MCSALLRPILSLGKPMEYLIIVGVVLMMALYVLIIANGLHNPEW